MGQCFGQALNLLDIVALGGTFEIGGGALDLASGSAINFISVFRQSFLGGINQPIRCVACLDQLFFPAVVFGMQCGIVDQTINFFPGQSG